MKIGDLVQHRLSPVVGIITKLYTDNAWPNETWADVTWTDGRESFEQINRLEAVCE